MLPPPRRSATEAMNSGSMNSILAGYRNTSHFGSLLRHRRHHVAAGSATITFSPDALQMVRSNGSHAPASCSSSCSSDDSDYSERALSEAQNLLGFPYPLLFCILISFLVFPVHCAWNSVNEAEVDHSYLTQRPARQLAPAAPLLVDNAPTGMDGLVFVAIGPAARSSVLGWSVYSAVEVGGWHGPVYIVTDQPEEVERTLLPADTTPVHTALRRENLHVIPHEVDMPPSLSSYNAKRTKCMLLHILPLEVENFVYIDSDIIVGKPMRSFWEDVGRIWSTDESLEDDFALIDDDVSLHEFKATAQDEVSLGLFEDAKAFTAHYCKNCDTWNTGIMSISRGKSDTCMDAWCEQLRLEGGTDQAALDQVISRGSECQNIKALDRQNVRMMKDVFVVWGMVGVKTFNHFTGIFRPKNLQPIHRRFYEKILGKDLNAVSELASRPRTTTS